MDNSRESRPSMMGRMRGSSSATARFPLPTAFFPQVECSRDQEDYLQQKADALRHDVMKRAKWAMSYEDGSSGWKLSSSQRHFRETGIRTYCRKPDAKDKNARQQLDFKCLGKVSLSLYQAMDAMYSDNTVDFRNNSMFLLENCLDAAVVHVIKRKSELEPHRYLGVNWMALKTPGLFAKSKDYCYLKSMGTMLDQEKAEVGYAVLQSIDMKECQSLEASHGLVRAKVSGVLLFKENPATRTTNVMWHGSMNLGGFSSSKLVAFVHESFTSCITNLNKFVEAKFMAQQIEAKRILRLAKNKKFTLIRPRSECGICGENMCKDCEILSRAKAFDNDEPATPTSSRLDVTRFCKRCVGSARRDLKNQPERETESLFEGFSDENIFRESTLENPACIDSNDRLSTLSSSDSHSSLPPYTPDKAVPPNLNRQTSGNRRTTPLFVGSVTGLSTSQVPMSPLSIRTQREKRRSRLETDPMESYDMFDNQEYGVPFDLEHDNNPNNQRTSYASNGSQPRISMSRDSDLTTRLLEIAAKAQETLDTTRRNSCMMSDTSSAPRSSELLAFQQLDQSISEQADLLNVIGFVSTGRMYMENEAGGVRISESSSISSSERFEVLT